jgi:hypothetical protein
MQETNELKRKLVVDLTNDVDVTYTSLDGKRVVILEDEDDTEDADSEEDGGNCCGICGSEYETREDDTADVCEECYESERNICHGCKEVFANAEFLDEAGEYCEGLCKECYRSTLDKVDPV